MEKLKKFLKGNVKTVAAFTVGLVVAGSIGYVIADEIASSVVTYTTSNNASVQYVSDALDDLYTKSSTYVDGEYTGTTKLAYWNNKFKYANFNTNVIPTGTGLSGTYYSRASLANAMSSAKKAGTISYDFTNRLCYIRTINGVHEVCLYYNNREFCLGANYWDTDGATTKTKIQTAMEAALGTTARRCSSSSGRADCDFVSVACSAFSNGNVECGAGGGFCHVTVSGSAYCN